MPDKEYRDYIAYGAEPADDNILLAQPDPTNVSEPARKYKKFSWLQLRDWAKTWIGFGDLTGAVADSAPLVAYIADPTNINETTTRRFVSDTEKSTWNATLNAEQVMDLLGTTGLVEGTNINITYDDTAGTITIDATSVATGDVSGPASSTDNALARFDLATGKIIQNSSATLDDAGNLTTADVTVSSATASTLAFISSAKKVISATGALFGTWIQTLTAKATPIDADTILVNDSASSFEAKKTTLTQFKAFLKTYFDTLYQTLNANLTAIAGLTTAANKLIYWTGGGSAAVTDLTALGRSLLGASTTQASAIVLGINKFPANTGTFPNGYSGGNYTAPANTLLISPIYTCGKNISKFDLSNVTTLGTNPTLASAALYEFNEVTGDLIVVSQLGQISITATGIASWTFTAIPLTRGKEYMVGYVFNASITLARFTTAINPLFKCNWSTTGTPNGGCTFGLTYTTTLPNTLFSEFGTNQTIILVNQV
jgi:hypothetical protein